MYSRYSDRADFRVVYIREAHPEDGWRQESNRREDIRVAQPRTFEDRTRVAGRFCSLLKPAIPVIVDSMENEVCELYGAFPERLYVIDREGRVAYKGGRGPLGFEPEGLEKALLLVLLADEEKAAALR